MLTKEVYDKYSAEAAKYLEKAGIAITEKERAEIQVAEYDLGCVEKIGLELVVYVNTERCCAKELVLLPNQTCPEHRHPAIDGKPGKEETFRCRYGEVYLYVPGEGDKNNIKAHIPSSPVTCFHEIVLKPGEQYTITPETWHWFQSGPEGAVISEFSTRSTDETDVFTDKQIVREPKIEE